MAAKYEEIEPPRIDALLSSETDAKSLNVEITTSDILAMERHIVHVINYQLTVPTVYTFLRWYMKVVASEAFSWLNVSNAETTAHFFAELCMFDPSLLLFPPSLVAACCMLMSIKLQDDSDTYADTCVQTWEGSFQMITGYSIPALRVYMEALGNLVWVPDMENRAVASQIIKQHIYGSDMSAAVALVP
jgi:hypothetical protein